MNKLIDQIGGRERLEQMSQCSDVTKLFAYEMRHMARALLAVLDAKPVVLPALFDLKMAGDAKTKQYFKGSNDTIKQIAGLLEAANVPYEVKK